jgi:hypothetical protein
MYNIKLMLSVPVSYWEQTALIKNTAKGETFPVHTLEAKIFVHSTKLEDHSSYWLKNDYHDMRTETYTNIHNI